MRPPAAALLFVVIAAGACSGSSVVVVGPDEDGKASVSTGGALPPFEGRVGDKGVEPLPTATPGQPTPVHPIETPAPAPTPRPL